MSKSNAKSLGATTRTMESFLAEGMTVREATRAMLKEVRENVTSSKFASVISEPQALVSPTGLHMDLTEMAARMCWNLHGCQSWTDAKGRVRREPLTPALMHQNYLDYMEGDDDLDVEAMGLQQPYATTAALEAYCDQANRGTLDEEQLQKMQGTMPWLQSATATVSVASATDSVNVGTSLDDVLNHMKKLPDFLALPAPAEQRALPAPPRDLLAIGGADTPATSSRRRREKARGSKTTEKRARKKKSDATGPKKKAPKKKTRLGKGTLSKEAIAALLETDDPSSD